ncbi:sialidase domain-containing protein [Paenibacillus planticolens]|uniref:sialidase domain-containing protein n=1 Tax=Paenibacillus planticolens TaxID=2654976 RepID=UPI001491498E|nr:sialidase domain-containing protein [Paenibacillus planticolens]
MRKWTLFLIVTMLLFLLPANMMASEATVAAAADPSLVLRMDNQHIASGSSTNLNDKVDALKVLDEGTIIVRFRYTPGSSIMSLFSLSNNTTANGHFHLYISPTAIGSENRYAEPGQTQVNTHVKTDALVLKENEVHTVAMVMDKAKGYKYFLDGVMVKQDTTSARKFLNNIYAPNSAKLGLTERPAGSNQYPFTGDIDFAEVYSKPLADQELVSITGVTNTVPIVNPIPDGAKITAPLNVFTPGFMNSSYYRIPALLQTKKGTLIAGIDRRNASAADSPNNIDAVVRRSFDQGTTWETNGIVVNDYPNQASNIDMSLMQDQSTGRIFSLVDGFPHGGGLGGGFGTNAYKGTGFKTINGKSYMFLTDSSAKEYTIREEGKVYDAAGAVTNYTVDMKRNLYLNGVKIDNVFGQNSPLKAYKTSYLELYYSDDEGATWTGPIDLNGETKEEWMIFLGTGPGSGIQLTQGIHKDRLVFPVYFLNDNNKQASAVIYSDDHGQTWHRGKSPNEGRDVGGGVIIHEKDFTNSAHELTESQVVEMPDGQLKLFIRNYSGYAQIATSFDGGETWDATVVTENALIAAYCQMTAIRYNGKIDGKDAVIFASPGNSSSRINGTVRVGLINENGTYPNGRTRYTFDWKYSQLVKDGTYAYSSLANLSNGEIGLFYEGTDNTNMSYIKFNVEYLKWQRQATNPAPKLSSIALEALKPNGYASGDKLRIKTVFNSYVMLSGNRALTGTIGGKNVNFQLVSQSSAGTEFVFEGSFPELAAGSYPIEAAFASDLNIYNSYGNTLSKQADENKFTGTIKTLSEAGEDNAATHLTGESVVQAGKEFAVRFELSGLTQNVFAQDISLSFDEGAFDFVSAKSLIPGVDVVASVNQTPGKLRFIVASEGPEHAVTGHAQVLEMTFKSKDTQQTVNAVISVVDATMGDEHGAETSAVPSSLSVEVTPAAPGIPGDFNNDGKVSIGDLAIIAAHYGKDSSSPDWEQVKQYDLDHNGSIDINDLAAVASKILE